MTAVRVIAVFTLRESLRRRVFAVVGVTVTGLAWRLPEARP